MPSPSWTSVPGPVRPRNYSGVSHSCAFFHPSPCKRTMVGGAQCGEKNQIWKAVLEIMTIQLLSCLTPYFVTELKMA